MQSKQENFSEASCWFRAAEQKEKKVLGDRRRGGWWSTYIGSAWRHDLVASRRALPPLCSAGLSRPHSHSRRRDSCLCQVPGVLSLRIMHARVVTSPRFIGSSGASDEQKLRCYTCNVHVTAQPGARSRARSLIHKLEEP
jgi:hypothetical protein